MPSDYTAAGGSLKLKGGSGIDKKKKKKKRPAEEGAESSTGKPLLSFNFSSKC
jgi:hypothetical protein